MSNCWNITIGFSRPWDHKGPLATTLAEKLRARSYKVVLIDDQSHKVRSVTDRLLETSQTHRATMR